MRILNRIISSLLMVIPVVTSAAELEARVDDVITVVGHADRKGHLMMLLLRLLSKRLMTLSEN